MTKKILPMGEDRDGLRDAADKVLSKGQPARRKAAPLFMDDDDAPLPRRTVLHSRYGAMTQKELDKLRADDLRIKQERDRYQPKNPFGGGSAPAVASGDTWNSPYAKVGGITMTKRQFMDMINNDLPALIAEAQEGKTQRGKFLGMVMLPALRRALDNGDEQATLPF